MCVDLQQETEERASRGKEMGRIGAVPTEFTMINRHRLLIVLDLDGWARRGQQPLYFGHHKERSANDSLAREECTTHRLGELFRSAKPGHWQREAQARAL